MKIGTNSNDTGRARVLSVKSLTVLTVNKASFNHSTSKDDSCDKSG
jgi:hypothetical protein